MVDNQWRFQNTRDRSIQRTLLHVTEFPVTLLHNEDDAALWKKGQDDYKKDFSAYSTWDMIRTRHNKVPWFKQGVPRFAFITWLAVKDRLSTGVRMRAWGIRQGCTLCGEPEES